MMEQENRDTSLTAGLLESMYACSPSGLPATTRIFARLGWPYTHLYVHSERLFSPLMRESISCIARAHADLNFSRGA